MIKICLMYKEYYFRGQIRSLIWSGENTGLYLYTIYEINLGMEIGHHLIIYIHSWLFNRFSKKRTFKITLTFVLKIGTLFFITKIQCHRYSRSILPTNGNTPLLLKIYELYPVIKKPFLAKKLPKYFSLLRMRSWNLPRFPFVIGKMPLFTKLTLTEIVKSDIL